MTPASFADRLALARAMIARGTSPASTPLADQLQAAGADVRTIHARMAAVMPLLQPDRRWRARIDPDPSETTRAYLLAALLGCAPCPHLKRGGPQVAIVRLALGRTDCVKCSQTLRRPPAEDADRCDLCGTREIETFYPFAMRQGPTLVTGDCCTSCADILGINQEAVAS